MQPVWHFQPNMSHPFLPTWTFELGLQTLCRGRAVYLSGAVLVFFTVRQSKSVFVRQRE